MTERVALIPSAALLKAYPGLARGLMHAPECVWNSSSSCLAVKHGGCGYDYHAGVPAPTSAAGTRREEVISRLRAAGLWTLGLEDQQPAVRVCGACAGVANKVSKAGVECMTEQERVALVEPWAKVLDRMEPEWFEHIDPKTLDMCVGVQCVLGQSMEPRQVTGYWGMKLHRVERTAGRVDADGVFDDRRFREAWLTGTRTWRRSRSRCVPSVGPSRHCNVGQTRAPRRLSTGRGTLVRVSSRGSCSVTSI